MSFKYNYVLSPSGFADAQVVREMLDEIGEYVNTLVPGGTVVTSLNAGTGIGLSATTGDITITNTGVTAISTTNVNSNFSAATGSITFSFSAAPTFQSVNLSVGTGAVIIAPALGTFTSWHMRFPVSPGTSGYLLSTDGNDPANTSWVAPTTVKAITGTTNQISVDNSGDPIVLSTPQDIAPASSPNFQELLLSGGTSSADLTLKLHDSHTGFYANGSGSLLVVVGNGSNIVVGSWDSATQAYSSVGPLIAEKHVVKSTNVGAGNPTVTIQPQSSFTSYTLTLPADDGTPNQYLTTDGSGNLSWTNAAGTGTVNSGTANQLAYYASSTNAVSGLTLITGNKALVSNSSGLPIASSVTDTELGYVSGVTSAIQTQLTAKATDSLVVHLAGTESITGAKTFSALVHITLNDATNNDTAVVLALGHNTTGTPATNLGTEIDLYAETSTTIDTLQATFGSLWTDVTHATRTSSFFIDTVNSGTLGRAVTITGAGHVCVGLTSSAYNLHVKGGNTNNMALDNDGSQYTELDFLNNGTAKAGLWWDNTNTLFVINSGGGLIHFNNNTDGITLQKGTSDATTYQLCLGSAGGGTALAAFELDTQSTVNVANTALAILNLAVGNSSGFLVMVNGADTATGANKFVDIVLCQYYSSGTITTIAASTVGSPTTRTYTVPTNGTLKLAMGSAATYNIRATANAVGAR